MKTGYDKFFRDAKQARKAPGAPEKRQSQRRDKSSSQARSHAAAAPEENMRRMVQQRIDKRREQRRRQKPLPIGALFGLGAGLTAMTLYLAMPERFETLLDKVEINFLGQANASGGANKPAEAEKATEAKGAEKEKSAAGKADENAQAVPDTRGWTPEELSFFSKLDARKKELDQREAELAKLEEELHKQKAELDERIKRLEEMRSQISTVLKSKVAADQQKVDKLVQFYSGMKPQQAAKIIETVNEDLAVEVLDRMKKKDAAAILNVMDPKKARRLSEMITGYRQADNN